MKIRFFTFAGLMAVLAYSQLAVAQVAPEKPRFQIKVLPGTHRVNAAPLTTVNPPPADNLYGIGAAFTATGYPTINTDESDLWPCFGDSTTPNTDCPYIGNPQVTFPTGGVAVGAPQYVWSLAACDGTTNGSSVGGSPTYIPCGQTETWYEDDTNDSTDDLTYSIVITQGANTIIDSGTVDFGPNPFGGYTPPADIIISGDQNFGTLGQTGKNNGNCDADYNYPTKLPPTSYPIVTAANKTCVDPVPGLAKVTATTEIATATWTKKGKKFSVTYTKVYSLTQTWDIWLQ